MKTKSCLKGASVFGAAVLILRLTQYILTIDEEGYYKRDLLSSILGYGLVGLLALGTIWVLICGFGGKKREVAFTSLYQGSKTANLCFYGLGVLAIVDGLSRAFALYQGFNGTLDKMGILLAVLCLGGGICWMLAAELAASGKTNLLIGILPTLHLGATILDYFWQTYKFIHVSEYILVTLGLSAVLLFVLAIMKPAAGGASTGQRICSTAGLTTIFCCCALLPLLPIALRRGIALQDLIFFFSGIFYLILAVLTLQRLGTLPPESIEEETTEQPDLSELYEYLSDLPEVEEEEPSEE